MFMVCLLYSTGHIEEELLYKLEIRRIYIVAERYHLGVMAAVLPTNYEPVPSCTQLLQISLDLIMSPSRMPIP